MREVLVRTASGHRFTQHVEVGDLRLVADEPAELQGEDLGPAPHEWVLAGLGACTSMTIRLYAERKGWNLHEVEVRLTAAHAGKTFTISRHIRLVGDLDADQRQRLIEIANKCPVHKTLTGQIDIVTAETTSSAPTPA